MSLAGTTAGERVERALVEKIRPALSTHAGGIRIERIDGNAVHLAMLGSCQGCYFRRGCAVGAVRDVLVEHVGDDLTYVVDGQRG